VLRLDAHGDVEWPDSRAGRLEVVDLREDIRQLIGARQREWWVEEPMHEVGRRDADERRARAPNLDG
jgi:hypothetical protein